MIGVLAVVVLAGTRVLLKGTLESVDIYSKKSDHNA
jgi:hypothetical protein